jgi:hypothetical protein
MWVQPLRWLAVACVASYYSLRYRVRGWGRLPRRRGPTLVVANHQHEIESPTIVALLAEQTFAWRYPIFTVSSRRMWEPGFLAERIPWLRFALQNANLGWLFSAIGMQPIENELHARPLASLAFTLRAMHGDLPLADVFRERALALLPAGMATIADALAPAHFEAARTVVTLSDVVEPYRHELLASTRDQLEADLQNFEAIQRDGATIFLMPEGFYTGDGKMQRLRGVLPRLAPLARIWIAGISYDPFASRRLPMLYRLREAAVDAPLDAQLKRTRPVTTSALLATWLSGHSESFSDREAVEAVQRQLAELPPALFVDPELRGDPAGRVRRALATMESLDMLARTGNHYAQTSTRCHPDFPRTPDMIAYQNNFHAETLSS